MIDTVDEFATWLNTEIENRGWSFRETGRRANLSGTAIGDVINQKARPGWDFCVKIAHAFGYPPEVVLRKAKLLPSKPESTLDEDRLLHIYRQLDREGQRDLLAIARTLQETRTSYKTETIKNAKTV